MPIYMDFHVFPGVTVEDVKKAHIADLKTQDKFKVKYHQFWVNEEAGTVFCLMEGPSPEACADVHNEAHGNVACNMIEVEIGMVDLFLGKNQKVQHGVVYNKEGKVDSGFRYIFVLDIIAKTALLDHSNLTQFIFPEKPRYEARKLIADHSGKEIKNLKDDSILAVFKTPNDALECALRVQEVFNSKTKSKEWDIDYKMGLCKGQPVTMSDTLFSDTIDFAKWLSLMASNKEIVVSQDVNNLSDLQQISKKNTFVKVINIKQQKFIENFCRYTETNMSDEKFSVKSLSEEIGVSRPQLYRRIKSISGRSPQNFIHDLKMRKALFLLKGENLNISEVAYEVGYGNPAYFSKCFSEKYGFAPSKIV
ncbi:nickel-binding protein [uncultured Algibacter sp.]|uniref:nickel-binding protein n=1 Tax=uncultured Algibacter sp. TaxID=298659 RepID=UPI002630FD0C|nr:nickel-binding protein [uncultured Algibacter sp.]